MMNKSGKITPLKAYLLDRYEQETKTKLNLQDPADQEVFQQYLKNNKDKLIHEHRDILADKTSTREIITAFSRDERAEKIIEIREKHGLDTIPLSDLLKMIEYDGSRNYSLINGNEDQFIRSLLHSKKHEVDLEQISLPGLDNNIKFQIDTWIAELVSNGLDATAPEHSIGKFGSGFLACLNTLGTQAESITVTTKKKHSPAYQLVFSLKNNQIVVKTTHIQTDFDHGTQISIQRNGEPLDSDQLIKELGRKFDSNNTAPININGEQINDLDKFTWSKPINVYAKSPVNVTASDNLVTVTDHGTGMDAHNLLYHLIFPKHGAKQPKTYTDKELEKIINQEVCFGYTTGSQPQTIVRCTIAGVGIEEFTIPKQGMIDNLTLILPSVGYVPESRNQIVGTKEILLGLQHLLDQVADSTDSIQQKVDILGGIAGAIRVIEERKTSEGISGKLSLTKYAQKTIFPKLLDQIKSEGKVAIQSHPATKMIVGQNLNFVLIDPLFVSDIDATLLPNCQKLDDIKTEKKLTATRHGKQLPFYCCSFDENSEHDYAILPHCIIVNEKYIHSNKELATLNTAINLNISYEIDGESVYFGTIKSDQRSAIFKKSSEPKNSNFDKPNEQKKGVNSEKTTFENLLENKKNVNKTLNSPEEIERFYEHVVDQIDLEFDGLREQCDGLFLTKNDFFIEQYIRNNSISTDQDPVGLMNNILCKRAQLNNQSHIQQLQKILHSTSAKHGAKLIYSLSTAFVYQFKEDIILDNLMKILSEQSNERVKHQIIDLMYRFTQDGNKKILDQLHEWIQTSETIEGGENYKTEFLDTTSSEEKTLQIYSKLGIPILSINGEFIIEKNGKIDSPELREWFNKAVLNGTKENYESVHKRYQKMNLDSLSKRIGNLTKGLELKFNETKSTIISAPRSEFDNEPEEKARGVTNNIPKTNRQSSDTSIKFLDLKDLWLPVSVNNKLVMLEIDEKEKTWHFKVGKPSVIFAPVLALYPQQKTGNKKRGENINTKTFTFIDPLSEQISKIKLDNKSTRESDYPELGEVIKKAIDFRLMCKLGQNGINTDFDQDQYEFIRSQIEDYGIEDLRNIEGLENEVRIDNDDNISYINKSRKGVSWLVKTYILAEKRRKTDLTDMIQWTFMDKEEGVDKFKKLRTLAKKHNYDEILKQRNEHLLYNGELTTKYDVIKLFKKIRDIEKVTGLDDRDLYCTVISDEARENFNEAYPEEFLNKYIAAYRYVADLFQFEKEYNEQLAAHQKNIITKSSEEAPLYNNPETIAKRIRFFEDLERNEEGNALPEIKKIIMSFGDTYIRGDRSRYREKIAKETGVIKCLHDFDERTWTNLYQIVSDEDHPLRVALKCNPFRNTTQSLYDGTYISSGNLDTIIGDIKKISQRRGLLNSLDKQEIIDVLNLIFQLKKQHRWFSTIHTQIINQDQKDNIEKFQNTGKDIISRLNGDNKPNSWGLNQYDRSMVFSRIGKNRLEQLLGKLGEDEFDGLCDRLIELNKENALGMLLENDKGDSITDLVLNKYNQPIRNGISIDDLDIFFELFACIVSFKTQHEELEQSEQKKNSPLERIKHSPLSDILEKHKSGYWAPSTNGIIEIYMSNKKSERINENREQIGVKNPDQFDEIFQRNKENYNLDHFEIRLENYESLDFLEKNKDNQTVIENIFVGRKIDLPDRVDQDFLQKYLTAEQIILCSYREYKEKQKENAYIAASEGSLLSRLHGPSSDTIIKLLFDFLQNLSLTGYENNKEEINSYLDRFGLITPRNSQERDCYMTAGQKINTIVKEGFGEKIAKDGLIDHLIEIAYRLMEKNKKEDYESIQNGDSIELSAYYGTPYNSLDVKVYLDIEQAILKANKEIWSLREKEFDNLMNKKSNKYKRHKDSPEAFFAKLYNKNPKDLVALTQFLYTGGEFLNEMELETHHSNSLDHHPGHSEGSKSSTFRLSEILACSNTLGDDMKNISDLSDMQGIVQKLHEGPVNLSRHSQPISSSINGQDKGTMIYLKEGAQNSLDAIRKKHRTTGKNVKDCVDINFGTHGERRVTQIKDPVGMSVFEVFNYLLPVYKSGKTGEDTGMFGQGFYSYAIGAKEVRIKTSSGNGKTIYLILQPIYNTAENVNNRQIIDFDVQCHQSDEQFTGTTIERIDENDGITANLIAMLGVNQMHKYIGTVDDIPIKYNGELLVKPGDKKILGATTIPKYGELQLISQRNATGKLSKDCLYIKDLDRLMLDCFPERIQQVITDNNLIINIPSKIHLNKTRNAIAHEQQVVHQIIQPYLYRLVMDYILNQFCHNSLKIPMLPEDYLYNSHYFFSEQYKSNVEDIIKSYNNSPEDFASIWPKNKQLLLDKTDFSSFITGVTFNNKGTQTSLREIRNLSIQKQFDRLKQLGAMSARAEGYINRAKDEHDKQKEKNEKITDFPAALGIRPDRFNEFLAYCQKLADVLIGEGKVAVLCRDLGPGSAASFFGKTIIFNIVDLLKYKEIFNSFDEPNSQFNREVIDTITHELSHYEEGEVYGSKRSTHEKDLETISSFESIQRKFITKLLRHFHSQLH